MSKLAMIMKSFQESMMGKAQQQRPLRFVMSELIITRENLKKEMENLREEEESEEDPRHAYIVRIHALTKLGLIREVVEDTASVTKVVVMKYFGRVLFYCTSCVAVMLSQASCIIPSNIADDDIKKGSDIMTGENCIYPLLVESILDWEFVGLEWANQHVNSNLHISDLIEI
ncbi:hypothetical protein ACS0TY_004572 [Phlomoides rotata]